MKTWLAVLTVPALLAWATLEAGDGLLRERKAATAEAKDALEGKAPPPLVAEGWMNLPEGAQGVEWSALRGKVVVIDFWGTW